MSALGYLAASIPPRMASAGAAVAIPILAVRELGDVSMGGALVAASLGPSVLAAPMAGALLDRVRRPSAWIAAAGLVTAIALGFTAFLGQVSLLPVFALLVLAGMVSPFYMGGFSSFVVGAVKNARRAFAVDALSYNFAAVAGPAFVAVLSVFLVPQWTLGILSLFTLLGAVCTGFIRLEPHSASDVSPWRAVRDGLDRMFRYRPLAVVTLASTLTQVGQGGLAIAAVGLSIDRVGSPAQGATVVTAFAVGSLLGAVLETARPSRARPEAVMMTGFLGTGVFTIAAGLDLGIVWTIVAIGVSGAFTASSTAAMLFLRSHLSPDHLKSQIFTVGAGLRTTATAAGAALAASASGLGGALTVGLIGVMWVLSAAWMTAFPRGAAGS